MAGSVKDTDRGLAALLKRAAEGKGLFLTVGIHAPEGAEAEGSSGKTVAEIATYNEFGGANNHPPPRPFIRGWADANEAKNLADVRAMAQAVIRGRFGAQVGLERLGAKFVAGVQGFITAGVPPPNAESTIARKGSSKPLVDTGHMKSAIRYKVEKEGD